MKRTILLAAALAALLLVAACGSSESESGSESTETTEATSSEIDVMVENATVRQPVGNATMTGAFMDVTNNGKDDVKLVKASVDPVVAKEAQVHETTTSEESETTTTMSGDMGGDMSGEMGGETSGDMGGEMAGMQEVESIDIPAGETVKLEKGGYHVMLMDVGALEVGQKINITLTFEDSEGGTKDVTVEAEVVAV